MRAKIFTAALFFAVLGAAQDVDLDDFPKACRDICRDIVNLSHDCGDRTDNNKAEKDCLCNANNAKKQASDCAACYKGHHTDQDGDGDDLGEIFDLCGWNYGAVPTSSTILSSTTQVITTTLPGTTSTETTSGTVTTKTSQGTTLTTTTTKPAEPTNTDGSGGDNDDDNAAAGLSAGLGLLVVGLFAALAV